MAKKNQSAGTDPMNDLALKKFFEQVDEVQQESRASDIGVVEDMYRYKGNPGDGAPASPAGEATGDGGPAGGPVPEPPKGGPGDGATGGRQAGRHRSVRQPQAPSEGAVQRLGLIGDAVPRIRMFLYVLKMTNRKGSNAAILLEYLERGVRKDFPELAGMVDALMASGGAGR